MKIDQARTLAIGHHMAGRWDQAEVLYRRILEVQPNDPSVLCGLGVLEGQRGRSEAAVELLERADRLSPDSPIVLSNLGNGYRALGKTDQAVDVLRRAVTLDPNAVDAWYNLGLALHDLSQYEPAAAAFQRALALKPTHADACYRLGLLREATGHPDEAAKWYRKAIGADPAHARAHNNIANILKAEGAFDAALAAYEQALAHDPDFAMAHWNRALLLLLTGQYQPGWPAYDWGWKCGGRLTKATDPGWPTWRGEPLGDKSILVLGEQGVGDEIFFAGLIPDLATRARHVTLECEDRLAPLFGRSFRNVQVVARGGDLNNDGPLDFQIASGSLPRYLSPDPDGRQTATGYLAADRGGHERIRHRYEAADKDALLIGIAWTSGNRDSGAERSIPLAQWGPILGLARCRFVSLQYGHVETQVASVAELCHAPIICDRDIDQALDLDGFASQISALDLVISIDNTTVHMAAALGKPVWVLLPAVPDWRWQLERTDSPWYPTVELFRQADAGNWEPTINAVADRLANLAK